MTTSSSRRGGTARYGERTCRRRWWLWLWTFARGGERSKSGVGASTRRSGSPATPAPLVAAAVAAAPTLAALPCRVVTRGEGTRIEDPSHQDRAGRGHMSLNPISSQSLTVLVYLHAVLCSGFLLCHVSDDLGHISFCVLSHLHLTELARVYPRLRRAACGARRQRKPLAQGTAPPNGRR